MTYHWNTHEVGIRPGFSNCWRSTAKCYEFWRFQSWTPD